MEKRRGLIFNYAFLFSLVLLALNDHVFKSAYHNALTGKLSDFAGMVVLPLLLAYLFPKLRANAIWLSMALFAVWKLPLSQPIIDSVNTVLPIIIGRVVDYTDFITFLIVPLPYSIIKGQEAFDFLRIRKFQLSPAWIVVPSLLILIATAPPRNHFHRHYRPATGNIKLKDDNISLIIRLSPGAILEKIRKEGIIFTRDSVVQVRRYHQQTDSVYFEPWPERKGDPYSFYRIPKLVIDKDTLKDIQFSFVEKKHGINGDDRTRVYLNSLTIEKDLTDEQVKEKMTRYYKKLLKRYFNRLDK